MSRQRFVFFLTLSLLLVLVACAPKPTAPPAPTPVSPVDTVVPVSTEPAAAAIPAAVAPALPAMELGSTWRYFDGSLLVAVPGGPFIMGSGAQDNPVRTVNVGDFWIYRTEVTNRMYSLCVDLGQCSPPDPIDNPGFGDVEEGSKPVVGVNWDQAAAYCGFVNGRLPTEAEWEKTARGPDGRVYPWGNNAPTCDLLNFDACVRKTTDVGTYPAGESYYKAVDMSGNVFEWVADWYLANYYGSAPTQDPQGPATGNRRSVRSSAYNTDGFLTEAARRFYAQPDDHRADLGFRCVVEDPAYFAPFCTQLLVYGKPAPGGAGSGQTLKPKCNQPVVEQFEVDCDQTNVWVDPNGPVGSSTGLDQCAYAGQQMHNGEMTDLYVCKKIVNIDVCGTCEYPLPSDVSCPAGYHQDGTQCVIDQGRPGQCPVGSTFDPTLLCCSVTTGKGASYNLCPDPWGYVPGDPGQCVNYKPGAALCDPITVTMKTGCGKPNDPCIANPDLPECAPCTGPNCCGSPGQPPCGNCGGPNQPPCGYSPTTCLAAQTMIDTPTGPVAVEDLRVGDAVWTVDSAGRRVSATILRTSRVLAPSTHQMVHLVMADGRQVWVSPQHPTSDGRMVGDLTAGDSLGGVQVAEADRVPYDQPATFDLLPSGETGYYWANGLLLGSTLADR
ncbi:MAG: SUMF1/EgtB/PvdO family nonheme iron enzyme [Chloroflexota bacterium]